MPAEHLSELAERKQQRNTHGKEKIAKSVLSICKGRAQAKTNSILISSSEFQSIRLILLLFDFLAVNSNECM